MKEKIKDIAKNDGMYLISGIALLIISILIITTTHIEKDYTLQLPTSDNLFALVSWIVTIVLGTIGIVLFKNIDRKKVDLAKVYLALAIPLGIIWCLVNPLGRVPDEEFHARKAMAISKGVFFLQPNENGEPSALMNAKLNEAVTRTISTYEEAWERLSSPETTAEVELTYTTLAIYAPICHMPQAFGMFITRIFGGSIPVQCYAARIVNFAFAVFLIYKAIKLIPFKKHIVVFLALLPLTMQELASMSSDALTISICIFFISYILYLKFDNSKEKINKKDIVILTLSAITVALCKIVYLPLVFILFVVPKEKYGSLKKKNIITIVMIILAIVLNLLWLSYISKYLIPFNPGVNSGEQVKYILTHPISYALILFRTINLTNQIVVTGLCGEGLGVYNAQASTLFIFMCILMFAALFMITDEEEETNIDWITRIIFLLTFACIIGTIWTSIYVQWTTVKRPEIQGIQSRYFLPILLLIAIVLDNKKIVFKGKLEKRYIYLFMLFFNMQAASVLYFTYLHGYIIEYYMK